MSEHICIDFQSWIKGTVYTNRFPDKEAILDPRDQGHISTVDSIIYKPKTRYHINRNRSRIKQLNINLLHSHLSDNDIYFDTQFGSGINHSKPVSFACEHNNSQVYLDAVTVSVSFLVTDCPQPMDDENHSH